LAEIKGAFPSLDNATILDIGTDCVKPLYIALKYEPKKIIGIDESLPAIASDIKLGSELLTDTNIRFYTCSLFNEQTFHRILRREKVKRFDAVLVSKTLHHLRTAKCVANKRDRKHVCTEDEKDCIYGFEEELIFSRLLELGKRVIVYEYFEPDKEDDDRIRGRGGYFTIDEWKRMFEYLRRYKVQFVIPGMFILNKQTLTSNSFETTLRKVDIICFYVEDKNIS
jgi:hypothetical protein